MVRIASTNSENQSTFLDERSALVVRIAFAGTPEVAVPTLEALIAAGHDISFVVTRPDAPKGRGRVLTPSPVAQIAQEHNLECIKTSRLMDVEQRCAQVDAVVVVAFGALVPEELLNVPCHGWINVHFSLLPAWRGAAPVQHAILAGDDVTGVSTFRIDEGLDTGPVLGHVATSIGKTETAGELLNRLGILGAQLLVQTLDGLAQGMVVGVEQSTQGISRAGKISVNDARIDWSHPALAIDRRIRAMTPDPGAWTTLAGKRIKLAPVTVATDGPDLLPGHLAKVHNTVFVGSGSYPVALSQVQPEGRTMMDATVWFNNQSDAPVFE